MELILWRHAEAEDGIHDMERRLTSKGFKQAAKMAAFLLPHLPQDLHILVSPAVRAQQTAQALNKSFITDPLLAPESSPQAILESSGWLQSSKRTVLIVGHQPTLGEVAAQLLTGKPGTQSFKKGAVWWFSRNDAQKNINTTLRLVIAPDFL
jgi:phosphohistidine phosphatase